MLFIEGAQEAFDGCFFPLFAGCSFARSLTSLPRRGEGDSPTERSRMLVVSQGCKSMILVSLTR